MNKTDPIYLDLQRFANEHKVILEDHGECGFGRPCVGFVRGRGYVDYRPCAYPDFKPIETFDDDRLCPPDDAPDAYHKHDCLAVLAHGPEDAEDYDEALRQLHIWVKHLESLGPLEVVSYSTGATGIQAVFGGVTGWAIRVAR